MNPRLLPCASPLLLALSACIVPPSRYERASWPPPELGPEHACCLHHGERATQDWLREAPPVQRVDLPDRRAPAAARDEASRAGTGELSRLYHEVRDERDALSGEVERLRASLERAERTLSDEQRAADELQTALEERASEVRALAERLVQAQIRRLEAEKRLLELRLESERASPRATRPAGS